MVKNLLLLAALVVACTACSGFHALVSHDPDVALLAVTPDDVKAYIAEMSGQTPSDPEAVQYVPDRKAYLVKEDYFDKAMSVVIMYNVLTNAKHIPAFLADYKPDTVGAGFKRSAVDMGIGSGLTLGVLFGLMGM